MANMGEKGSNIMRVTDPDWPALVLMRYEPLLALKPENFIRPWFTGISRWPFTDLIRLSPLPMPFVLGQGFPYRVSWKAGETGTNFWGERSNHTPALNLQHDLPARAFAASLMLEKQLSTRRVLRPRIHEQTVQRMRQVEDKVDDIGVYRTGKKRKAGLSGAGTSGQGPEPRAASMQGEKVPISRHVFGSASQGSIYQVASARGSQEPSYSAAGGTQGAGPGRMDAVSTPSPVDAEGFLRFPLLNHVHSRIKIAGNSRGHQIRPKGLGEIMMTPLREIEAPLPFGGKGSSLPVPASRPAGSYEVLVQEPVPSGGQEFAGVKETPKETGSKSLKAFNSNMTVPPSKEGALPRFSLLDFVQARMQTGGLQQPRQHNRVISNNPIMHGYSGPGPITSRRVFTEKAKGEISRISRAEESQGNFATGSIMFAPGSEEHKRSSVQSNTLSKRGEPRVMKRPDMALSGPHQVQRLSPAPHSGASPLPLVQLQGEGVAGTTMLPGEPGARPGSTGEGSFPRTPGVQGGSGESVASDSGLNSGPGGGGSLQGIDIESLADEVCAIIERRLIMERESRGL